MCDCIGHVNRVSYREEKEGREVEREEEEIREGIKFSHVGAQKNQVSMRQYNIPHNGRHQQIQHNRISTHKKKCSKRQY